jgi:hypothetical protein
MIRVQPNLVRIAADGDHRARTILQRVQGTIGQRFLDSLTERDYLALGRYGTRQSAVALRRGSAALLRDALMAAALGRLGRRGDPRDVMVSLALHYVVAQKLGLVPPDLFNEIAACLPDGSMPDLLRNFGARQDVTLEAFGWELVQTPEGPDFIPI